MYQIRSRAGVKAAAFLLFLVTGTAAAFGIFYCCFFWNNLFNGAGATNSYAWNSAYTEYSGQLEWVIHFWRKNTLTYLEQKDFEEMRSALSPEVTNFRYIIRDNVTGDILLSSSGPDSLKGAVDVRQWEIGFGADAPEAYAFPDAGGGQGPLLAVETGVDGDLNAADAFQSAWEGYRAGDAFWCYLAVGLLLAALGLLAFLTCCAGRRADSSEAVLNWLDRVPYDLYLCAAVAGVAAFTVLGAELASYALQNLSAGKEQRFFLFLAGMSTAVGLALSAAWLMSTAARVKAGTLLRNTVMWRLAARFWRGWKFFYRGTLEFFSCVFSRWSLTGRVVLGFTLFVVTNHLFFRGLLWDSNSGFYFFLLAALNGAALFLLCRWTLLWSGVRAGTRAIVGGNPGTVIDTRKMRFFPSLREHAGQLNDLGNAINTAVEERMKSERMKAELITNVSHDLKTPLTSIINYVDLLKKEDAGSEKAREYLEVLDRKSQRLKKLTEDLVEASKASAGALTVNLERLGAGQLVTQALGEYAERFAAAGLAPVPALPEREVYVHADGRRLWRVLDNLMGNCVKYAMPGTRVYIDVISWEGRVTVSIKNISALPLNIPAETLLERFVRGDESRSTEGSGLGLSIARSLTELQGGIFRLDVDGDLFKATISLPEME